MKISFTKALTLLSCFLLSSLANAATTKSEDAIDGSSAQTTSFQPQQLDFGLWNVDEEQFSKTHYNGESDNGKPTEYQTTFWTVTSKVGHRTHEKGSVPVLGTGPLEETLQGNDTTEEDELLKPLLDDGSVSENQAGRNDTKASENGTSTLHGEDITIKDSAYTTKSAIGFQEDIVELHYLDSSVNETDSDMIGPEPDDGSWTVSPLEQISENGNLHQLENRSVTEELYQSPTVALDQVFNGTRDRREGFLEGNFTSLNESEVTDQSDDLETYGKSSRYFGAIEKFLNDGLENDTYENIDIDQVNITDDEIVSSRSSNSTDSLLQEFEDEELVVGDIGTGENQSHIANIGYGIGDSHGNFKQYSSFIRLTRSRNLTGSPETDHIWEFENNTAGKDDDFQLLEGDLTNETDVKSDADLKGNSTERVKTEGGRSFDVNRTAAILTAADDSINAIDSKDHEDVEPDSTTVIFDLFGYVNSTWYIVNRPTTESTSRETEKSTEVVPTTTTSSAENLDSTAASLDLPLETSTSSETDRLDWDFANGTTDDSISETSAWSFDQNPKDISNTTMFEEVSTYEATPVSTTTDAEEYDDGNVITLLKHLRLSVLSDLLKRTGLDREFSKTNQSVTIFAPTDEAFNSLSPSTIRKFQKYPELLKNLILHHIIDWQISAKDFENELILHSLAQLPSQIEGPSNKDEDNGHHRDLQIDQSASSDDKRIPLKLNLYDKKGATINGARFILADVRGTNGIVHVITKVLYRFARYDILSSLRRCSRFSTMLRIAEKAGVDLKDGPYTIFAPVNEAWDKNILSNLTNLKAKDVFNSHVLGGSRFSSGLSDEEEVDTLKRFWTIKVGIRNGELKEVNRARVIMSNVPATDGVIHVIDRTLHETKLCDDFF